MIKLRAETIAPYFAVAALVHAAAVATRFDGIAAKLPETARLAILLAQFPLIVLSGLFEGRMDHGGAGTSSMPRWMQIESRAVKLAFTFAFIFIAVVVAQTWDLKLGPLNPEPPKTFPEPQRALWFAMFTAGMFFPFYLLATKLLMPILRLVTAPLRGLPLAAGAVVALAVGGGLGLLVMSLVTSTELGAFIASIKAAIARDPALLVGVTLAPILVPLLLGLVLTRRSR